MKLFNTRASGHAGFDAPPAIPSVTWAALDGITQGLLVIDARQHIVFANAWQARLLGRSRDQLIGRPVSEIGWADEAGQPLSGPPPWTVTLETAQVQRDVHLQAADSQGGQRSLVAHCSPLLDECGTVSGVLISLEDVTLLQQAREQLRCARAEAETARRARHAFVSRASHELRTPMNAILGFTELLKRGFARNERECSHYLDTIEQSGRQLLGLIDEIAAGRQGNSTRPQATTPSAVQRRMAPARVLVVDDGAENRELLALVLTQQGCRVEEAENGKVALEKLAGGRYDLVLMDVEMPVMDGMTATREMRRRGQAAPVVALTAHAAADVEQEVLQAGCTACLAKPIDVDLLLQRLGQLLGGACQRAAEPEAPPRITEIAGAALPTEGPIRSRYAANTTVMPIVRKFAARLEQQLQLAQSAVQARNLPELERLAHWLAGSAGTVGYDAFTQPARELEAAARSGDAARTEMLLQRVLRMAGHLEVPGPTTN